MTEEDFLKRWSRRKREADAAKPTLPPTHTDETDATAPESAAANKAVDTPQPEFDPASLPPIESITAVSDITAFLRAGVPVELTRAALRRVWTADPAIRNFVGLAENAWDFTDPDAMPGFGPLESTDEIRRMIAQVIDQIGEAVRPTADGAPEPGKEVSDDSYASTATAALEQEDGAATALEITPQSTPEIAAEKLDTHLLLQSKREDAAAQRDITEDERESKQSSHRTHGSALPR